MKNNKNILKHIESNHVIACINTPTRKEKKKKKKKKKKKSRTDDDVNNDNDNNRKNAIIQKKEVIIIILATTTIIERKNIKQNIIIIKVNTISNNINQIVSHLHPRLLYHPCKVNF